MDASIGYGLADCCTQFIVGIRMAVINMFPRSGFKMKILKPHTSHRQGRGVGYGLEIIKLVMAAYMAAERQKTIDLTRSSQPSRKSWRHSYL